MKRILTGIVLIPVFIYLVALSPQWLFLIAVSAVAGLCFREFCTLVAHHKIERPGLFGYAAGFALILLPQQGTTFIVIVTLLAMALALRLRDLAACLPYAGALVLGILYTFGTLRCAVDLREVSPYWTLFALSLNWAGDIVAFYVGGKFGRHKMAPGISPGKSWEGGVASLAASLVYAAIYFPRLLPATPLPAALAITALANIAGQFGDLSESALKRGAGVKDSGGLLPGHGGWLDRVDSSLFALPVVYFLVSHLGLR